MCSDLRQDKFGADLQPGLKAGLVTGATDMTTVLITGANRGIGLEFARQYSQLGAEVIATCRRADAAGELIGLDVEIMPLDVSSKASCEVLAQMVARRRIDILINNAGSMGTSEHTALNAAIAEWTDVFMTNVLGPAMLTRALLPNLKMSDRPIGATIGSQAGIHERMNSADLAIYRSTKAAAHAVTISLGHALKDQGVIYVSLRPGRTKTDMTGDSGIYEVEESVRLLRGVLENVTLDQAGLFLDRSGAVYPYAGGFVDA
jgi:NAD(P)-dependent dehydrogenase (short-subunit alcohol dehydrogenase family)